MNQHANQPDDKQTDRPVPAPAAEPDKREPSCLDFIDEIRASVPDEVWAALPTDLSKNLDHYLYGCPKDE